MFVFRARMDLETCDYAAKAVLGSFPSLTTPQAQLVLRYADKNVDALTELDSMRQVEGRGELRNSGAIQRPHAS